ncbi:unnamed protein product [Clonostachys rosea]|uniref:Uncharacterized protein n=1 Tax=Bionectria ochroleuca TaxID=29856 RepID=A0ABY6U7J8_BIOOC|nr:unnamed protein product [Clonostachys rosea]
MSIQKIAPSAVALNQEANFGLATINFDFSVLKYEAPVQFRALGQELSPARRATAEEGTAHVTARKLEALFRQCLPSVTHLTGAYGSRASEIASNAKVNPKPSREYGLFADYVGIDGTSIWAAATSGAGAIAVHLLACMLARMWSRPEAIAIWAEIVAERKKELAATEPTDPQYQAAMYDSKIQIGRDQLAEWDSSARSWLQSADKAMEVKQTQLMLILNNVSLPVSTKPTLYRNVLHTWLSAMTAADNLVRGMPQSVESGSILLGLASWHLYPDLLVLLQCATPVSLGDALVASGGILTIGLYNDRPNVFGVSWSLPLGHLRYYGAAVVSETSLFTQGNCITIPQLAQVMVGSMTRHWGLEERQVAEFLQVLWDRVRLMALSEAQNTTFWLGHLAQAVRPLIEQPNTPQSKHCSQLMKFGARRLVELDSFMKLLDSTEAAVYYYRKFAREYSAGSQSTRTFLISYRYGSGSAQQYEYTFEYATLHPIQRVSHKRLRDGEEQAVLNPPRHIRWVLSSASTLGERMRAHENQGEDCFTYGAEDIVQSPDSNETQSCMTWTASPEIFSTYGITIPHKEEQLDTSQFLNLGGGDYEADNPMFSLMSAQSCLSTLHFDFVTGERDGVCLLVSRLDPKEAANKECGMEKAVPRETVLSALQRDQGGLAAGKVLQHLCSLMNGEFSTTVLQSLRVLATISSVYESIPGTTLSLDVALQRFPDMNWMSNASQNFRSGSSSNQQPEKFSRFVLDQPEKFSPFELDQPGVFACIILFQTGKLHVLPTSLQDVMAVAIGDSIFIDSALLCDPLEQKPQHEIRRIQGSIGRPGIAMLIPPRSPMVRKVDIGNWHRVNHNRFDGLLNDAFQGTTLHLGFTGYSLPLDVGEHGVMDIEIYFLESIISVHDCGQWVADLDIISAFRGSDMELIKVDACTHVQVSKVDSMESCEQVSLISIDDWNEILDPPSTPGIVRSLNNWIGRLATAVVCLQLGHSVVILPNRLCWQCVPHEFRYVSKSPQTLDSVGSQAVKDEADETELGLTDEARRELEDMAQENWIKRKPDDVINLTEEIHSEKRLFFIS